jgi:hypothetical protein
MAKKRKSLLPKRIAGVKVPKSVRKGAFGQLLASRTGQALLAEAIMAAGAVGVAKQASDKSDGGPRLGGSVVADALRRWQGVGSDHGHSHGQGHGHRKGTAADATIAYALGEAARVFVRTLNEQRKAEPEAEPAHEVEAEWRATDEGPDGSKKKPASHKPGPA